MKTLQILSLLTLALFLVSTASALTEVTARWSNTATNLEISPQDTATFDVAAATWDAPMEITIELYTSQNQLIKTFYDGYAGEEFAEDYQTGKLSEGDYEVRIVAYDYKEGSDSAVLYLNVIEGESVDTISPKIIIYSPEEKTYTSKVTELKYRISDENLDENSCEYSTNNGATWYSLNCENGKLESKNLNSKEGKNTWIIRAEDTIGNVAVKTVTFTVDTDGDDDSTDTTNPIITIISPESKTYSSSSVQIKIKVNEKLKSAWFILDGSLTEVNLMPYETSDNTFVYTLTGLSNKQHTLELYAKDLAGNIGNKNIKFTIDTSINTDDDDDDEKVTRHYEDDFDREAYLKQFEAKTTILEDETQDTESSKAWIIWLIIGLIILVVLIIVISMLKR